MELRSSNSKDAAKRTAIRHESGMNLPVVMSIAGSDNSAGAGAQADLKTFSALGTYGVTAITCVVAEVPGKVSAIQPIEPRIVAEQIRLLFEAFPISAVKTGMLYSREIIEAVAASLQSAIRNPPRRRRGQEGEGGWASQSAIPLVVDPVMVATSGDPLLQQDAIALYRERIFPMAKLITPNLDEAAVLLGRPLANLADMRLGVRELAERFGTAILLKGGHLREAIATDLLFADGEVHEFTAPFVPGVSTHGTGCTYSAAIAASLGKGLPLRDAVGEAKCFVTGAITHFFRWTHRGRTTDALRHFAPDVAL